MQPAAVSGDRSGVSVRLQKGAVAGVAAGTVNSEAFWRKKVQDVPVDQVSCCFGQAT